VNAISRPWRVALALLPISSLVIPACQPRKAKDVGLPPAYTYNQITDPALREVADEIQSWASRLAGADQKPLYSRIEILSPVPIVQPYGVGVFQEEVRLPVIFTTGPGWAGAKLAEKEAEVARTFVHISGLLKPLNHEPALRPTLTVQTPEGIELSWINHLDPSGKNVHGSE
jgi:hypothetical protein